MLVPVHYQERQQELKDAMNDLSIVFCDKLGQYFPPGSLRIKRKDRKCCSECFIQVKRWWVLRKSLIRLVVTYPTMSGRRHVEHYWPIFLDYAVPAPMSPAEAYFQVYDSDVRRLVLRDLEGFRARPVNFHFDDIG